MRVRCQVAGGKWQVADRHLPSTIYHLPSTIYHLLPTPYSLLPASRP